MGESVRGVSDFKWEVGAFIGVDDYEGVIGGRDCAGIIWISSMKSGILVCIWGNNAVFCGGNGAGCI